MINLRNIQAVSKYERKTLFRSWLFRIFSALAIFILVISNLAMFINPSDASWSIRAIPANIPYINVLYLNLAQAIIAIFLASNFLARDKKLDTTEVIYTRPISNFEYIIGKTNGIISLFLGLVILVLLIGLSVNIIKQDVNIVWQAYLYYPLLITVPTLTFIIGLSYLSMSIIKNQAVTFIVLLGYIGLNLFYIKDRMNGLFDYMAFYLPLTYSDIIGFSELSNIFLHRMSYFLLGLGFIFITIRFLNRLPQSGKWKNVVLIMGLAFICGGCYSGYQYYNTYNTQSLNRNKYIELNNNYVDVPTIEITENSIQLNHKNRKIEVKAKIKAINKNKRDINKIILSLNPGFEILSISSNKDPLKYVRNLQIIEIELPLQLKTNENFEFSITYKGRPIEDLSYLDINEENHKMLKRLRGGAALGKQSFFIENDFVLLTPEINWYPTAGVGYNTKTCLHKNNDFVRYYLQVSPNDSSLTVISSGKSKKENGATRFRNKQDLNALAVIIGNYKKTSVHVDKINYNLYYIKNHNYFKKYFEAVSDTIPHILKEVKEAYEYEEIDLYYSFDKLDIIEVPIHYHAYERAQTQATEYVQPEMILLPEKGAGLKLSDFAKDFQNAEKEKNNQTMSEEDIATEIFKKFVENVFYDDDLRITGRMSRRGGRSDIIDFSGVNYTRNPFCVFPMYYNHLSAIHSKEYPFFNSMVETYLKEGYEISMRQSFIGGISATEHANLAFKNHTIAEVFSTLDYELASTMISQAGSFIFNGLQNKVTRSEFDRFLYYYIEDHPFQKISLEQFARDFYNDFQVDILPYLKLINTKGKIPEFIVSPINYIQTRDDIGEVYLLQFDVTNYGEVKGLIDVSFRSPGRGGSDDDEKRIYELDAGETKDIQIALFERPRMMNVNTLISANIPSNFSVFLRSPDRQRTDNIEEYAVSLSQPVNKYLKGEIIVDNEDSGFTKYAVSYESKLKQYINSQKTEDNINKYRGIQVRPSSQWVPVVHSAFYGTSIKSAYIIASGDGENEAIWSTVLPQSGIYEVYTYIPMSAMLSRPQRRNQDNNNRSSGPRGPQFADKGSVYNYKIISSTGEDDVEFELKNIDEGWNKLGSFHFGSDTAKVILSNNAKGKRVFADAIKWVRQQQ